MIAAGVALALAAATEEPRFRVFDARDQSPIAGATLELWTEDGEKPLGAMTRVAVLHSGADGTGEFSWLVDGIRPSNVRVSKAGYASHSVSLGDLEEGVELHPAAPLSGRVVDLDGQPVARAVVRSRETCAHAVFAAETWTDADGRFVLADCPADAQLAELEVRKRCTSPAWTHSVDPRSVRESAACGLVEFGVTAVAACSAQRLICTCTLAATKRRRSSNSAA